MGVGEVYCKASHLNSVFLITLLTWLTYCPFIPNTYHTSTYAKVKKTNKGSKRLLFTVLTLF